MIRAALGLQNQRIRRSCWAAKASEPKEDNLIGFRGASRYYDDRYRDDFPARMPGGTVRCAVMGLKNVKLMIPFCRTLERGRKVLDVMASG